MIKNAYKVFMNYVTNYDTNNVMVAHKITHTLRVANYSERIAKSIGLNERDVKLSWIIGLLHDFGRFEQLKRYGTFRDSESIDHAELGANLLFVDRYIDLFIDEEFTKEECSIIEKAIRQHNKLTLSGDLTKREILFSQIIRDADKVDIFRVVDELPFEQRAGKSLGNFIDKEEASFCCMENVYKHRCIPRAQIQSRFELLLSHICLAFELYYEESKRIAIEQGYLKHLLSTIDENGNVIWNDKEIKQLEQCKIELEKCFNTFI